MRLIDADALKAGCIYLHKHIDGTLSEMEPVRACTVGQINDAPTIDAAKVRHGRWEITDAYPHWMCCSVCHKAVVRNIEVIERYEIPTSFCPNCGARMEDT
jgi:hypothetical protein